ncbi:YigZ family protein [Sunxiuqinia sp. A32]|uniref:YigZ family protein n=1 Tax=Sunxiuqinia sp. A32 TaxID=3461496 RepID=UPI00404632CB
MNDSYLTIVNPVEGLFKDKGSKFIAYAFPVSNEEEIKEHIQLLKKEHYSARHHCYAWRLGASKDRFRANDDGEPSSTAGKPILGQIQKFDLTNVLIVVVRYFGGTLLGVSGLINAYREAAADSIANATIVERLVETTFWVEYEYALMNDVMKLFKDNELPQLETHFDLNCKIKTAIRLTDSERIISSFKEIEGLKIVIVE